jgi:peptidyl-prolyl cis-trans isomerase SurA
VSPTDYKRELRNQLLDAKVMNLRLQGRIRVSEEELKREYDQLAQQERQALPVSLRVVRLAPSSGAAAPPRTAAQLKMLAKTLVEQARSGADFAELSRQHSSDEATRTAGGQLAPVSPSELPRELAQQVVSMNPGDVSAPIETGGLIVVLKLEQRTPSALPPFSDVLPQLEQRVQLKKMEAARRTWLDALRKTTHVEVRL